MRFDPIEPAIEPYDLLSLYPEQDYLCLLENPGDVTTLGRYSFLCTDPFLVFRSKRNRSYAGPPGDLTELPGAPFDELQRLLARYGVSPSVWQPGLPPFLGGAVGYLSYEMLYELERIPDLGRDDFEVPDSYLFFCDTVTALDKLTGKAWAIATGFGATQAEAESRAEERLATLRAKRSTYRPNDEDAFRRETLARRKERLKSRPRLMDAHLEDLGVRPVVSHAKYVEIVDTAKEHIFAGDIFEVCTSQRFDTELSGELRDVYRILRTVSQAPFSAYLKFPEFEVASSSPERYLRLDRQRWAETRPIKGTRPRGRTPEEDEAYKQDLATTEKDHAENIMIVDLARNDLGRVCEFGTVIVPELRVIESYTYTHQLVSTVGGHLRDEFSAIDLIRATFPGGSMTGAPKVEAMKIIDRLEPVKRGVFSGCIGYFDFDGAMDLNIVIRTLVKRGDRVSFHVGGAIVADSVSEEEYQETLDKAHGMVTALEFARQGGKR
jgi:para-aminobenzoate synthetase component 1